MNYFVDCDCSKCRAHFTGGDTEYESWLVALRARNTVHPCGREHLLDLFDEYADATSDGYWNERAATAARQIAEAVAYELSEHGAAGVGGNDGR